MLEGLKIWREVGDPHSISLGLNFLVPAQIKLERYEEAKASMRESIALCEQTKNRWGMGTAYRYLGLATLANGQVNEAQAHFRKSLEIFGEYVVGWDIAISLAYLGDAVRMSGDLDEARKVYLNALRISLDSKSIPIAMDTLLGLALLQVRAGNPERAFEISYHVLNHPSITQETKECAIEVCNEAQKKMTDIQTQVIKENASSRTFEEIVSSVMLEDL